MEKVIQDVEWNQQKLYDGVNIKLTKSGKFAQGGGSKPTFSSASQSVKNSNNISLNSGKAGLSLNLNMLHKDPIIEISDSNSHSFND
jgi:hypothetical protein